VAGYKREMLGNEQWKTTDAVMAGCRSGFTVDQWERYILKKAMTVVGKRRRHNRSTCLLCIPAIFIS
jgi:hypothetical protein